MTSKEHRKHPKLAKPKLGNFGRNEWAILGAPCTTIQELAQKVTAQLSQQYECAYVDAKHIEKGKSPALPAMLAAGAATEYTDAIQYRQLTSRSEWGIHPSRDLFRHCDLILVNGNHHTAAAQVVVIDPVKAESLQRRVDQLTNVRLLLMTDESTEIFGFLLQAHPSISEIPRLLLQDEAGIIRFFENEMQKNTPHLNGLVLAGGQSQRMGQDKGAMKWHGKPQREYAADLLQGVCESVFISCRQEQQADFQTSYSILPDTFLDLGPYGALLSAFRAAPDRAWLVVACDLPLLDQTAIDFLVQQRCVKKIATTFQNTSDQLPEPLITIWEPKAYPVLLSFLGQGFSCPRKVLIHSNTQILTAPNPQILQNVNTPGEMEAMLQHPVFNQITSTQQPNQDIHP